MLERSAFTLINQAIGLGFHVFSREPGGFAAKLVEILNVASSKHSWKRYLAVEQLERPEAGKLEVDRSKPSPEELGDGREILRLERPMFGVARPAYGALNGASGDAGSMVQILDAVTPPSPDKEPQSPCMLLKN